MKKVEWLIAAILITAGLVCLSMAPMTMMGNSMGNFLDSLISVCLWTAFPLILVGSGYWVYKSKNGK